LIRLGLTAGHPVKKLIVLLVVLLVILQYQLWIGDGGLRDLWELHQEVESLKQENERLQERNAALNAEVLDLKQGLDAIEEHAREDLGMVKEGETFYQIVE
jgi:cell division protein FtsB